MAFRATVPVYYATVKCAIDTSFAYPHLRSFTLHQAMVALLGAYKKLGILKFIRVFFVPDAV